MFILLKGEATVTNTEEIYLCIDLKSFFASVECAERGLDPMTTNLVVADPDRSTGTICLAVTPAMKALGVRNRCRVYEIPKNIKYIMAPPRMQKYIDYAANIYGIYLRYISRDDIFVYSIDEAFINIAPYLKKYSMNAHEFAVFLMNKISSELGIRASAGIGTNLYLTKIALDVTAKHSPDSIGYLDEELYRKTLWDHRPLTDFWRIGEGTARRLAKHGIYTMRQIALMDEDVLYREFGIDAELLIDHAWGIEPTTIADIKAYRPKTTSLTSGQVLMRDYTFSEGRLILREMMDLLALDMVSKNVVTASVSLWVGYTARANIPPARGSAALDIRTNSDKLLIPAVTRIYEHIVDPSVPVRRISISVNDLTEDDPAGAQLSLIPTPALDAELSKSRKIQEAVLGLKHRYGADAVLKGMNFEPAATTRERNHQIGGHKSGL